MPSEGVSWRLTWWLWVVNAHVGLACVKGKYGCLLRWEHGRSVPSTKGKCPKACVCHGGWVCVECGWSARRTRTIPLDNVMFIKVGVDFDVCFLGWEEVSFPWCRGNGCVVEVGWDLNVYITFLVRRRWCVGVGVDSGLLPWCRGSGAFLVERKWFIKIGVDLDVWSPWCRGDGVPWWRGHMLHTWTLCVKK